MRLLNVESLQLETFMNESEVPPFAILSHTWGPDELTLQDLQLPAELLAPKRGWQKITRFRDAVAAHRHLLSEPLRHLWVDTVCIDKTSSAELSEAINSMFRWYRNSVCCFALLEDVDAADGVVGGDFEASRWFMRGWTLQELLAPQALHFFDGDWKYVGSKASLVPRISAVTNIAQDIILTGEWPFATIAQRMSWASGRVTTRPEDMAYCLLGIFDVNMPMLYGEGERAFVRLQEEIIKESDDESIFAWDASGVESEGVGVFATHPRQFRDSAGVECLPRETSPFVLTNKGLQITLPIMERTEEPGQKIALLSCADEKDVSSFIGIKVQQDRLSLVKYTRTPGPPIVIPVQNHAVFQTFMRSVYLAKRDQKAAVDSRPLKVHLKGPGGQLRGLEFIRASPDSWHRSKANTMTLVVPRVGVDDSGTTSSLLFRLADTNNTVCMVLSIQTAIEAAHVGLVQGPDEPPDGETLQTMMGRFRRSAATIAKYTSAELVLGEQKISAKVATAANSSVIEVMMGNYRKDGFKFVVESSG